MSFNSLEIYRNLLESLEILRNYFKSYEIYWNTLKIILKFFEYFETS